MSVWTTANTSRTRDPRVRVGQWGEGNWRTLVQEDGEWDITGPPYPTKAVAQGHVDDVLADYFGELPSRALLAERIERALAIAAEGGSFRKAERMAQALHGYQVEEPPAELREEDLEVSTVRPGAIPHGSGGQTVGQFDSYVRVTHKPTGIVVERDSERSQLMNKSAALDELRRQLAGRQAEPDLREHITALHQRLHSNGKARSDKTQAQMADSHAEDHHKFGSTSHHHGPNAGPHARPAGWRDGSGVVLTDSGRVSR